MAEIERECFWWHMGHDVFVVDHTPLIWPLFSRELSVGFVTNTGLAEGDHIINIDVSLHEPHTSELGDRCTQTVASDSDTCCGVKGLKACHLNDDLTRD